MAGTSSAAAAPAAPTKAANRKAPSSSPCPGPAACCLLQIAMEEALRVKTKQQAEEVVAVSIGPRQTADTLRHALAMGADRAVHVQTDEEVCAGQGTGCCTARKSGQRRP